MDTDRLYYRDSYLREFSATVLEARPTRGEIEVVLDRTAFYPEGGGQPSDLGTLAESPVLGVVEQGGRVVHRVSGTVPDGIVSGRIDWERRFDHMQQHSGQHLLSQAFSRCTGADTVSFHLGAESSTIDLAIPALTAGQAAAAEEMANQVVFENRPILVHMVEPSDLARFELRKGTDRTEQIRLVEVSGFDAIPCGGTHCHATGEIGMVKLLRWDRRGGNIRVEFLCGGRALRDYGRKNESLLKLAAALSVKDREVVSAVERLLRDTSDLKHQAGQLKRRLLEYRAAELAREAAAVGGVHLVASVLPEASPEDLKLLAGRLVSEPGWVVLLATAADRGHLLFARSDGLPLDAASLLREVCTPFGGRGGGQPRLAQGGIPQSGQAADALELAKRKVEERMLAQILPPTDPAEGIGATKEG